MDIESQFLISQPFTEVNGLGFVAFDLLMVRVRRLHLCTKLPENICLFILAIIDMVTAFNQEAESNVCDLQELKLLELHLLRYT